MYAAADLPSVSSVRVTTSEESPRPRASSSTAPAELSGGSNSSADATDASAAAPEPGEFPPAGGFTGFGDPCGVSSSPSPVLLHPMPKSPRYPSSSRYRSGLIGTSYPSGRSSQVEPSP